MKGGKLGGNSIVCELCDFIMSMALGQVLELRKAVASNDKGPIKGERFIFFRKMDLRHTTYEYIDLSPFQPLGSGSLCGANIPTQQCRLKAGPELLALVRPC